MSCRIILFDNQLCELYKIHPTTEQKCFTFLIQLGHSFVYFRKNLKFCEFENPFTILEHNIFRECIYLSNVELPTKLKRIPYGMFASCHRLSKLEIPNTVSEIGDYAFYATGFMDLTIPDAVPELSNDMFLLCNMNLSINWKGKYYTYKDLYLYQKFS